MKKNRQDLLNELFLRRLFKRGIFILAGSVIQGFAMGVFLFPHSIPSGGGAGIAVLLNYWFQTPMSIGLWLTNFIFLISSVHYLGKVSAVGTIITITITSVSVNVFEVYAASPFTNLWSDLLIGSVILGSGVSILLKQGVSNGGIGFAALAISKYKNIEPAKVLFVMNGSIIIITSYVIDWAIIVQAVLCQWISTRIVSWLLNASYPKSPLYTIAWRKKS
ncbi:YitT family protein [Paenibacillus sp. LHD-38]|uniref:YitT family protein n=1 Tax=Paenibacillus sp. LHD-38 TaxID=3072143 RepID=UPI00280FBCF6|nr:YitT family protein [Paenibacillus sp. LHD-38]MDQ8737206.1 YitT family protein [Paenibacillus sp. LHD-38]